MLIRFLTVGAWVWVVLWISAAAPTYSRPTTWATILFILSVIWLIVRYTS